MKKTFIICSVIFLSCVLVFSGIKELSFKGNRKILFFSADELNSFFAGDTTEDEKLSHLYYIVNKGIRLSPDELIPMLKNKGIPDKIKKELPSLMKKAGNKEDKELEVRILSGEPGLIDDLPDYKQKEIAEFILSDFTSPVSLIYYDALNAMSYYINTDEETEKFIENCALTLKDIEKTPNDFISPGAVFGCLANTGKEDAFLYFMRLDSKEARDYRGAFFISGDYISFVYDYMENNENADIIEKTALIFPYDREFQERYTVYKNTLKE